MSGLGDLVKIKLTAEVVPVDKFIVTPDDAFEVTNKGIALA